MSRVQKMIKLEYMKFEDRKKPIKPERTPSNTSIDVKDPVEKKPTSSSPNSVSKPPPLPKKPNRVHDLAKRFEDGQVNAAPPLPKKPLIIPKKTHSFHKSPAARYYCRAVTRKRSSLAKKCRSTGDLAVKSKTLRRRMSKSKSANNFDDQSAVTAPALSQNQEISSAKKNVTIVQIASMTAATHNEAVCINNNNDRPSKQPPRPPPKPSRMMLARSLRQLRPLSPGDADSDLPQQPSTSRERGIDVGNLEKAKPHPLVMSKPWIRSKSSIRKPSMRPPPPPISPKPQFRFTWQLKQSTSASNIYQAMSSPEDEVEQMWKPSVPSMPPPAPPVCKMNKKEELYEDIDIGFNPAYAPSPSGSESHPMKVPYSPKYRKKSQQSRHHSHRLDDEQLYRAYHTASDEEFDEPVSPSMFSSSIGESEFSSVNDKKTRFGTWGASKTRKARPASHGALELEKLLRIKSEIQLNFSKKMDKIKSKVSQSPSIPKSSKVAGGNVLVDQNTLRTDSPSTSKNLPDACLYGDDWSSADDFEEDHYGGSCAAYSSGSSNYAIGKSKSASHASNFWKSIDSALTLGRKNKEQSLLNNNSTSIKLIFGTAELETGNDSGAPHPKTPKSSLLDEIESEYMQTDCFRKTMVSPFDLSTDSPPGTKSQLSKRPTEQPPPMPTSPPGMMVASSSSQFSHSLDSDEEDDDELDLSPPQVVGTTGPMEEDDLDDISLDVADLQKTHVYTSRLPEPQPLYQIYMLHEQEKILDVGASSTTSGASSASGDSAKHDEADSVCGSAVHEDSMSLIRRQSSSISTDSGRGGDTSSHLTSNTSMRRERLTAASIYGSQRSLWCELLEVKQAGILNTLDDNSKKLQEAFFEVITSEASYLRSINVLITRFMAAPELAANGLKHSIITVPERKHLFSNIIAVRDCSEKLLCDLENRLEENLVLPDVCDILCEHFEQYFESYVKYCSNQVYQDRTLKRLKVFNSQFMACINKIETDRQCHGLDMRSFLMLPMQRVTRYPLLVYAILERVKNDCPAQKTAARALMLANQVVRNCNEGARRMERTEQLLDIERRLLYKSADLKRIPLVTSGRYVVKNGQVTEVYERRSKSLLQSKQKTRSLYIFLFSDLLLIAKKRVNGTYVCKDYAQRRFVVVEPLEPSSHKVPQGVLHNLTGKPHLFICVLLQNAYGKQVELLLNVESESDRERWLSAMRPPSSLNPDEKIYAEWDCPQAVAVHPYAASQEDELELEPGDLINILRKMPDGWHYGERARDGKGGWFPSSYVQLVLNDHVRANNYKQRLKVIEAAAVYRTQQTPSLKSIDFPAVPAPPVNPNPGANTPLMDRLRRLSNPRGFFINL